MKIPQWIWRLPFMQRERIEIFAAAQKDMLETLEDDIERRAEEKSNLKLAELLTYPDLNQIVTFEKNQKAIYIGGERAEGTRLANLKAEAEALTQMEVWRLISETPKQLAHKAMFVSGESIDEMKKGRAILYMLDTQNRILDVFKSYQQTPP